MKLSENGRKDVEGLDAGELVEISKKSELEEKAGIEVHQLKYRIDGAKRNR